MTAEGSADSAKVDALVERAGPWREAFARLRALLVATGLDETVKWGQPCYCDSGRNIVLIHGFKAYCALLFFKGALIDDPAGLLVQQTENVQAARQMRFASLAAIEARADDIPSYVAAAIAAERAGGKVALKATEDFPVAEEFRIRLDQDPALAEAFRALTPGRQRAYLLHFASAKQAKTRAARVEKLAPRILDGLGLDDERR